ncbi:hypothetical protein M5225_004658 [Vibrio vulnificus]|uniref:hypothetical protein n=1 Tax=Vibrio vulnificus TaxID=672 RepID=UPI000CD15391|nr:hypothetical protein [Vibrio vulnificus]EGQ7854882.1 hypothetical protein [Vibrio vulnificus]EGQ8079892.1 hypothetical protein [Vibrio vulnificus]EHD0103785.1 hypothetical protein [Vibrio vulnificus]EHH0795800.1 hypothetical protein [Vibrio vulnificus]EHK8978144.1 hypothetical protein [Vibrio vulnificus]
MIVSPNNWMIKAGAHVVESNRLVLPLQCLLVPMGLASEAIVSYRNSDALNERIKHGLVVVTMVRVADTAYFTGVARMLYEHNKKKVKICEHCLRGQLWPTKIKEYRQKANKNIIHKMEQGLPINNTDLEVVELYYEEMFKHPLINPIHWPSSTFERCQKCVGKGNKRSRRN